MILDMGKLSGAEQLLVNPAKLIAHCSGSVDPMLIRMMAMSAPGKRVSMTNTPYSYVHTIPQINVSIPNSAKAAAFVIKASSDLPESGT